MSVDAWWGDGLGCGVVSWALVGSGVRGAGARQFRLPSVGVRGVSVVCARAVSV